MSPNKIFTAGTETYRVPNTIATAASLGSDLNGMAVVVNFEEKNGNDKVGLIKVNTFIDLRRMRVTNLCNDSSQS